MMFGRAKPREHLAVRSLPDNDDIILHDEIVLHPELEAMARVRTILEPLDGPARTRVLNWVVETLHIDPPAEDKP